MSGMIEFICTQCGRALTRPLEDAGTTAYCECGQTNAVPWVARRPAEPAPAVEQVPEALAVEVVAVDTAEHAAAVELEAQSADVCFQHDNISASQSCQDCSVRFCDSCLVRLQGAVLCGACKNFRLRRVQQPGHVSVPAIISLVLALCGAPIGLCTAGVAESADNPGIMVLGAAVPIAALVLGIVGLVQIEREPKLGGRSLAISGIVTGLVGLLMGGLLAALLSKAL